MALALGVVRNGSLEFFYGHGVADMASKKPVAEDTVFRIASITKTFTAIAVMQLWEQGLVDLDAPANDYLRAYRLVPAKSSLAACDSATPADPHRRYRRAWCTRSGMLRRRFRREREGGTADALSGRVLPRETAPLRGAGHHVHDTADHGPATLGQIVEDVSGTSLDRYFREHVFGPLGMADTTLVRSERGPVAAGDGVQAALHRRQSGP